ncbi:Mixed-lineage leukemia [Echinococcus multilocularis]|uniref:Mixed-lineage leukemia n=1 Tax=Echinococcus multilocularis TaxID=6211 RepID=A0A0S4MKE6_ECHMU|nr:Mixed-lineage leukemia [Echinococcus multilocularis]
MKREVVSREFLDFGELTPVFWALVFAGGLLIVTVIGIACVSCYLCTKRKVRHHRPSPIVHRPDVVCGCTVLCRIHAVGHASSVSVSTDAEVSSFLLRPPPTNPDYAPTPQIPRSSASLHSQHQHPPTELTFPPSDFAPPSYAEVVQVSSPYSQTNVTQSPASVTQDVTLSTSHEACSGVEVRPSSAEPSAPYPTLPHLVE